MRWLFDENFHHPILAALLQRIPEADILTVQQAGLRGAADAEILEWAAQQHRVVITQDAKTMPLEAYERLHKNLPVPGVVVVPKHLPLSVAIDDLETLMVYGEERDFEGRVLWLPL